MNPNLALFIGLCVFIILNLSMYYFLSPSEFPYVMCDLIGGVFSAAFILVHFIALIKFAECVSNKKKGE